MTWQHLAVGQRPLRWGFRTKAQVDSTAGPPRLVLSKLDKARRGYCSVRASPRPAPRATMETVDRCRCRGTNTPPTRVEPLQVLRRGQWAANQNVKGV